MAASCPAATRLEGSDDIDLLAVGSSSSPAGPYASFPAVSGTQLAFVTEGEVWIARLGGGGGGRCEARRITDHSSGQASRLHFSPDGSLLAYSLAASGYQEVHCCAARGGRSKRLTYLGASVCHVSDSLPPSPPPPPPAAAPAASLSLSLPLSASLCLSLPLSATL
eukprot:COSAG03_NODE_773_length_5911_cov_7.551961_2_plen_166_part_00